MKFFAPLEIRSLDIGFNFKQILKDYSNGNNDPVI
jgi:hypothetical protein